MKRKTAKDLLAESFMELAGTRPIDRITVREITTNCAYSTATFYRHFRDKYELIAWAYSQDLEKIMEGFTRGEKGWRQMLSDAAGYYAGHKDYLENLLLHTSGFDSFLRNMIDINFECLRKKISDVSADGKLDEKSEMLMRVYINGTVRVTCEWILGKYQVLPELLSEIYDLSLPEALRTVLY